MQLLEFSLVHEGRRAGEQIVDIVNDEPITAIN